MIPPEVEQIAESLMYDDWAKQNPGKKGNGGSIGNEGDPALIRIKSFAEFCQEYVPLAYTIEQILRASSLYTLTARTGHGKTALLVIAALAIATGRKDILGLDVPRGRVAFLTFENPDDVRMRFMIAAYAHNVLPSEINDSIVVLDARMKPELVYEGLDKLAKENPFNLVIVDTFAAFFDGDNTNDATQGGEFMRRMRPFSKIEGKPTTLVAAHPIKNAPEDNLLPYGSARFSTKSMATLRSGKTQTPALSVCTGKASYADWTLIQSHSASKA
jgi:RecA-family ATPase